jgi:hypothetical protein
VTAPPDRQGDVLFLMHSPAHVRNFESVLRVLAARGHRVTVRFEERKKGGDEGGLALIGRLGREYDSLHHELQPSPPPSLRGRLRLVLEAIQDYLRYLDPPYAHAPRLRARALAFLPAGFERALASALRAWPRGRRALASVAMRTAHALGTDSRIRSELVRRRPGVVIASPLVHFRSRQRDWVRAAADVGVGTMFCVYSWDNLTNRGLMHAQPDRVAVWNDAQRTQAVVLHGARADSVEVTGAWPYDHWFGWRGSRSRAELCRQLGLPVGRAMILYACSSRFIAERERPAVLRWLRVLRSSPDPRVAMANVIVRPHPLKGDEWCDPSPRDAPGLAVFPPGGADPVDTPSRSDYFDSIALADAVVGVNTSVLIESAILDRPALAFPAPYFRSSQDELPHFRELIGDAGILKVSTSMDEHLSQLSRTLADASEGSALRRRFVDTAIRPRGDSPSPSERVAATVEELLAASRR